VLGLTSYDNLTQVLETDKKLHDLIRERTKAEVAFEEINIEGMAFDPVKKRLVLGFRDPEFNNMALVAFISNPKDVFERNAKPEFDEVTILDIDGGGIRSLNYDPVLKSYVIANEVKDENGQKFSQLWTWSGNPTDEPAAQPATHYQRRSRRFDYGQRQAADDSDGRRRQRFAENYRQVHGGGLQPVWQTVVLKLF